MSINPGPDSEDKAAVSDMWEQEAPERIKPDW